MSNQALFDGWSVTDVVAIVLVMALMATALVNNRRVARFFVDSTPWFPSVKDRLIREDRPERLQADRERRELNYTATRWGLVAICTVMLVVGFMALITGRNGGVL
jgi:hypothetical protein